jgi:hypothetical protein
VISDSDGGRCFAMAKFIPRSLAGFDLGLCHLPEIGLEFVQPRSWSTEGGMSDSIAVVFDSGGDVAMTRVRLSFEEKA